MFGRQSYVSLVFDLSLLRLIFLHIFEFILQRVIFRHFQILHLYFPERQPFCIFFKLAGAEGFGNRQVILAQVIISFDRWLFDFLQFWFSDLLAFIVVFKCLDNLLPFRICRSSCYYIWNCDFQNAFRSNQRHYTLVFV